MPRRILIAPDKFKGSLSALEAAEAIARGIRSVEPDAHIDLCPIADGGEGFAKTMAATLSGRWVDCQAVDALGRPIQSHYFLATTPEGSTAVMEMAETAGMWRLSKDELAPLRANTRGVGMQMVDAIQHQGAQRIFLGLGGSATNDAGCGMAHALGYRFLDDDGQAIEAIPQQLDRLCMVDRDKALPCPPIVAACDVTNPLTGAQGATAVFGPQKGAGSTDLTLLENNLNQLVTVANASAEANTPGAGAAGGLGFGLLHFAEADLVPGFDLVADLLDLDARIQAADWIITGEGSLDAQSLGGKGPVGLARRAGNFEKPVTAFCGSADGLVRQADLFSAIHSLADTGLPLANLIRDASTLLEQLVARAIFPACSDTEKADLE